MNDEEKEQLASLMTAERALVSEETAIQGIPWSKLKKVAMRDEKTLRQAKVSH